MAAHVAHDLPGLVNLIGDSGDLGIAQRIGRNPRPTVWDTPVEGFSICPTSDLFLAGRRKR